MSIFVRRSWAEAVFNSHATTLVNGGLVASARSTELRIGSRSDGGRWWRYHLGDLSRGSFVRWQRLV